MAYLANTNFDQYLTTTLNNHKPNFVDNIFGARVLGFFMKESGAVKISGGHKIVRPVLGQVDTTPGFYGMGDTLTVADAKDQTSAEWAWKLHSGSVKIHGLEEARNMGEAQIIDLLSTRIQVLEESIINDWNLAFWDDGATPGVLSNSEAFHSIPEIVGSTLHEAGNGANHAANIAAAGNIEPDASNDWWQTTTTDGSGGGVTEAEMRTMYNTVSIGADVPNVIITDQTQFETYEALLTGLTRYEDVSAANKGFRSLMFKGTPVTYDDQCPTENMYFLNTKYLEFVVHQNKFLETTPFVRPYDQDYRVAHVITYGNLICTSRRKQGVLYNLAT